MSHRYGSRPLASATPSLLGPHWDTSWISCSCLMSGRSCPIPQPSKVWRVGELVLPPHLLQHWNRRSCILSRQHSSINPVGTDAGELALKAWKQERWNINPSSTMWYNGWGKDVPLDLTTCGRKKSWSWGHKSSRTGPAPNQLQYLGEEALHLTGQNSRVGHIDFVCFVFLAT